MMHLLSSVTDGSGVTDDTTLVQVPTQSALVRCASQMFEFRASLAPARKRLMPRQNLRRGPTAKGPDLTPDRADEHGKRPEGQRAFAHV